MGATGAVGEPGVKGETVIISLILTKIFYFTICLSDID